MWLKRYMQFNFCEIMAALKVLYNKVHQDSNCHRFASVKAHLSDLKTVNYLKRSKTDEVFCNRLFYNMTSFYEPQCLSVLLSCAN